MISRLGRFLMVFIIGELSVLKTAIISQFITYQNTIAINHIVLILYQKEIVCKSIRRK